MYLDSDDSLASVRGGILAIGNFDGVHRGHRAMLERLVARSRDCGTHSVVLTFEPHPLALLSPRGAPPALTTIAERARLLKLAGVDRLAVYPTTKEFLSLTADEFFHRVVRQKFAAQGLVEGPNFHFGRNREGNVARLAVLCRDHDMTLDVIEPCTVDGGDWVSSTAIRSALRDGDLEVATRLLGHPYRLTGRVVTGVQRGRTIGFPTANLAEIATLIPGAGVYAGEVSVSDRRYAAAVHIGSNPTFDDPTPKVEVHLIDYQGDLYHQQLSVDLHQRLRGVQTFATVDALIAQMHRDVEAAARLFAER